MTDFAEILGTINYGLVAVYGFFLSIAFSGGFTRKGQKTVSVLFLVLMLLVQTVFRFFEGVGFTKQIYPLIVHLPLILILILYFKRGVGMAIVSVFTAYSCCQLPRMVYLFALAVTSSEIIGEAVYTAAIVPIFIFLYRRFSKLAYTAMAYSKRSLVLFGILPTAYYIFDYVTTIYTKWLYEGIYAVSEAVPTVCILFYVGFISLYHEETQRRSDAELESSTLSLELKQAETEIAAMKLISEQNAVFRHDLRHHINLIMSYADSGDTEGLKTYLRQIKSDTDDVTPTVYSKNNTVNFTLSYFKLKAEKLGVVMHCSANVPDTISLPDTDLCTVLSNAIENAVTATEKSDAPVKEVSVDLRTKKNKLLISVTNPYSGTIETENGLPVNRDDGHGFGIKSIKAIAERHNGFCSFEWDNNVFKIRIVMNI